MMYGVDKCGQVYNYTLPSTSYIKVHIHHITTLSSIVFFLRSFKKNIFDFLFFIIIYYFTYLRYRLVYVQ